MCPECATGKHAACNGQTWDHERDEPDVCPCWVEHPFTAEQPEASAWLGLDEEG